MITCANCHSENREGEFFCAVCGCGLINDPRTPIYMRREGVEVKTDRLAWGTSHFEEGDQLVIYVRDDATPIIVEPGTQMVVGRSDAYSGVKPDLDLAAYRAVERGVSRYHAAIHRVEQALMLEDLNSSNGTRVNGRRVPPGQPWVLHDGDELRLGNLTMHLYFTAVPRLQRS
ncbi:MAG: zinc ribbon domain-containing protein [Anaerolineae bacterium]